MPLRVGAVVESAAKGVRKARNFDGEKERLCLTDRFDTSRQNACADNQD